MTTTKAINNTTGYISEELTMKQYSALQNAFNYFNKYMFNDILPNVMLTLSRKKNVYGFFCPSVWTDGKQLQAAEIAINPDYVPLNGERDIRKVYSTLVHEMVHLWQETDGTAPRRCYHNKDFSNKMEFVGLITSTTGAVGGKRTGQHCSHYIKEGGMFAVLFEKMPAECIIPYRTNFSLTGSNLKKVKRQNTRVTYYCPLCGSKVRGKQGMHLICGDCQCDMEEVK